LHIAAGRSSSSLDANKFTVVPGKVCSDTAHVPKPHKMLAKPSGLNSNCLADA